MAHRIIIMHDKGEIVGGGAVAPLEHTDVLEETVTQMISTFPRMFRRLKHQARSTQADGPTSELGESQIWALHSLAMGSQLTSELAQRHNVTNPTMTRIVDGLVEKGYVKRLPSHEDRRQIHLQLTEAGREAARYAHEQFRAVMARFISPLSEKQLNDIALACKHLSSLMPEGEVDYQALCPPKEGAAQQGQRVEANEQGQITLTEAR
jgi:DNA-binding MarR family transcriptional regulator